MLKDIDFQPTYFKTRNELFKDFYKPCMENAIQYNRISGYFGSSVFLVINEALKVFISKKGHIKLICSPILTKEDIIAIKNGYNEKQEETISNQLNDIIDELQKTYPNSSYLLSKLIANNILEIKLAVFGENSQAYRLMHDKAGVFIDEFNNAVAFRGSINETFMGMSQYGNSESFDVFTNWENTKDKKRVNLVLNQFENMWMNKEPNVKIFDIPNTTIQKIKSFKTSKNFDELIDEVKIELNYIKPKWYAETIVNQRKIKKHQELILNNWEKNNRCGLFEMCTGSGKTFTALCAIRESIMEKNEIPIIIVPSKLLLEQWKQELKKVFANQITILLIGAGNKLDKVKLKRYTQNNIFGKRCILTTYQSASQEAFLQNINFGKHIFLICDEVHNIGSQQNLKLLNSNVGPRIGLSATPKRYFDDVGTQKIINFFGGIINPKYQISDAINDGVLSEYFYDIFEVQLSSIEQEKWNKLTKEIKKKIAFNQEKENIKDIKGLEILLFERSDIVKKAQGKIYIAEKILIENYKPEQKWIIYLDDTEQLTQLKKNLNNHKLLKENLFEYHTNTENDLPQTIKHFIISGGILLSINCLDEGVDIPEIDHAIILASSQNSKQYIQRRGRVLRKSKSKNFAYIYDCIVSASLEKDNQNDSIIKKEIIRAIEFSKNAKNINVKNKIKIIMNNNNIEINED